MCVLEGYLRQAERLMRKRPANRRQQPAPLTTTLCVRARTASHRIESHHTASNHVTMRTCVTSSSSSAPAARLPVAALQLAI